MIRGVTHNHIQISWYQTGDNLSVSEHMGNLLAHLPTETEIWADLRVLKGVHMWLTSEERA